jgi:ATP-dependent DNA helicase DinG
MNIEKYLQEFVSTFLPKDFQWRKSQKEAIIEIYNAYKNGVKTVILDSPVGSGKSLIGMVVAWVLNQENKKGYILASEISLQEQYEKDFNRFHFHWGSIKGIDNYMCIDNMEKNSLGTCRIRNKPAVKMPCYKECPYYSARAEAAASSTSLLNYAYWLIMMNYVNKSMGDDAIFKPRDFCICDEGHKLLDIIQNHYSPHFDKKTIEKLEKLTEFFAVFKVKDHIENFKDLKKNIALLFKTENQDTLHEILLEIEESFEKYFPSIELLKKRVEEDYPHDNPPREWREALRNCDWLKDLHCKVEDFNDIIDKTATRNLIKNPSGDDELTFNCLHESYMMHKYFHQWTGFTILMSATFADPSKYLKSIALSSAKYIKIDSHFNFSKSPIYFYNKNRMTYNQMEKNLPWLYLKVDEILEKHKYENGIIHTASYDLAMKIYENIPKRHRRRILIYNGTEEKREVLNILKVNKNKVLMGPSLTEGLDLRDDWSRFQIFAKVPYLSLSDRFVATKLKINPDWYREKAVISILQGTGRSVRSETDWAITYILDGALADLIHNNRKSFPTEFMQRLKIVNE